MSVSQTNPRVETTTGHLSPQDLAERENVPLATVYGWNTHGDGPRFMKIGLHVRYTLADVLAWEAARYTT